MGQRCTVADRERPLLWPPPVQAGLSEDYRARWVAGAVEQLDLRPLVGCPS